MPPVAHKERSQRNTSNHRISSHSGNGQLHTKQLFSHYKPIEDYSLGLFFLIITAPIMLVIALIIRITSQGPALYRQQRTGLDGRPFIMLKFRTMPETTERGGPPVWGQSEDKVQTRTSRFLRYTSLDELPQLWNIMRGEMSLVGPRPERPEFSSEFEQTIPGYSLRLCIKPGMTGWAQINGWRGDTDLYRRVSHDLSYIENMSLWLDLKIIMRTILGGFLDIPRRRG